MLPHLQAPGINQNFLGNHKQIAKTLKFCFIFLFKIFSDQNQFSRRSEKRKLTKFLIFFYIFSQFLFGTP